MQGRPPSGLREGFRFQSVPSSSLQEAYRWKKEQEVFQIFPALFLSFHVWSQPAMFQGSLLALYLGITVGHGWGTIWDARI